ncbi:autotransporter domain-containing protein [Candidatus Pelagibacter sp. Uisw_099_02]|uniref:autotransporter domain-containing protein n=1 Tax=Candidatus Pelagibacter sp. Uisw_099_02 TaxID=3230981 RepID=UPI0039E85645
MKFFLKKLIKYSFIFFITMTLLLSKVLAEPTLIADFDISSDEGSATGITFKPDGTKMYITGIGADKILQYNLTTAFDITSATLEKSVLIQSEESKPQDVKFNSDGTVIFILGTNNDGIDRWSLSTPYDIGSITVDDTLFTSIGGDPRGFAFNNDGTKMFVLNQTNTRVEEYNLSTPYNPDTKTLTNTLTNELTRNFHQGLGFNADGSKMFVVKAKGGGGSSNADNKIDEYALSTAFDISTATLTGTFSPTHSNSGLLSGMAFDISGTKMYHLNWGTNKEVQEYSLTCPFKVTSSSTCDTPLKNKDVRGIIDAQINTAKNFANDSSQSALKRLTILRANKGYNTNAQKVELLFQNELFNKISNNVSSSTPAKLNPLHQIQKSLPENWAAWTEGSIRFGKIGDSSLSSAQDMDSLGITVGADKIDNDKIVGVALRVGYSDVDVGTFGSAVDTNALSLSVYGSNSLDNRNFLKHVFGVSYLDTNILRVYEGQSVKNAGSRKGKQAFGSLNFGREYEYSRNFDATITPTAHIDGSYTTLDSYTESGPASSALSFNKQHIRSLMASLGVLIDRDHNLENSTLKSRFNLEYGKEFASDSHVITKYVTVDEAFDYRANQKDLNILTVGQGFDFIHDQGLTIRTDYQRQKIFGKGFINELFLSIGFISRKKTEFALGLDEDMTSSFKISKALNGFDLGFNLENDFLKQENYNANLSLLSKF